MKVCAVDGCQRSGRLVRGWCNSHYKRWAKFGDPNGGGALRDRKRSICAVADCTREHYAKGYCMKHHWRLHSNGDPLKVQPLGRKPGWGKPKPPCKIDGCTKVAETHKHGLCGMHKRREERHGSPFWAPPPRDERFWAFVDRRGPDECWEWTGGLLRGGYGQMDNLKAHRIAYELLVGPIPDGLHLDHLCHNRDMTCKAANACPHRRCVNPAHLEAVTASENSRRSNARNRLLRPLADLIADGPYSVPMEDVA